MSRRYYSRRTRVIRPKKKWASNFRQLTGLTSATVNVRPKSQAASTHLIRVWYILKVKGDMRLYITASSSIFSAQFASCVAYIMYLPEGAAASIEMIQSHPEWIMAWSPINVNMGTVSTSQPQDQNVEKFSMSSRLKRNLNSGDKIILVIDLVFTPEPTEPSEVPLNISYQPAIGVQYWTCAN
ncbi:capsid protein [Cattle blood-associated circovirus-like virus]|uniref:Capsid protein n=1 Tax=Cattle blood-associated circovirus-like virus TaxID=2077298 RepID=A0A2L0HGW4_9VIRU|nr:capsid protein [Cattle blood-associated circovirus-like virus]AUX80740.1 capsid protein [Cattle blood-associated circovirus-like virus]